MAGIVEDGQVFRWRRFQLHISPDGLVWTEGKPLSAQMEVRGSATYSDLAAVGVDARGRSATLTLQFRDGKSPWVIAGVPAVEAEWAADLIRGQTTLRGRSELRAFRERVPFEDIRQAAQMILESGHRQIVDLVDLIIIQAIHHRASDVHFEPFRERLHVRYRIDGVLHDVLDLPADLHPRVLTRLKVVARLTVYRRDVPQEGRIIAEVEGRHVDLRVAAVPTIHGEKVTVRLFDTAHGILPLGKLGMSEAMEVAFRDLLHRPQGTILLTGPSNSGKTTTMYAALQHLHETNRHLSSIATVEDPVEHDLQVISQTQVNPTAGLTFAAGLRTVLRQDPEVIMIGEIRDPETAKIAVRAGLTGHLILSTVHARSAPAVFVRLMEMDVEPFLVASSATGVMAQRLVRVTCPDCRERYQPPAELLQRLGVEAHQIADLSFVRGQGCKSCDGTGYHGRTGIFQLLTVDDLVRDFIVRKAAASDFERLAKARGVATLLDDGLEKVKAGVTTLEELERVGAHGA